MYFVDFACYRHPHYLLPSKSIPQNLLIVFTVSFHVQDGNWASVGSVLNHSWLQLPHKYSCMLPSTVLQSVAAQSSSHLCKDMDSMTTALLSLLQQVQLKDGCCVGA